MTDPAPSPPAGQPPVPVRPMPRLGHGVHWPAIIAEIEADQARQQAVPADDLNAHGGLDETFVAGLLQAAAGGSETGGNPSGGPPYTHRYVPPSEDEPPAPSYTYTAPSRHARWRRALDRVRRFR